jgi:hypothetical protein
MVSQKSSVPINARTGCADTSDALVNENWWGASGTQGVYCTVMKSGQDDKLVNENWWGASGTQGTYCTIM